MKYQTTIRNLVKRLGLEINRSRTDWLSASRTTGCGNIIVSNFGQENIHVSASLHRGESRQEAYTVAKEIAKKIRGRVSHINGSRAGFIVSENRIGANTREICNYAKS